MKPVQPSTIWPRVPAYAKSIIMLHQKAPPIPVGAIAANLGLSVKLATLPDAVSGEIRRVAKNEAEAEFAIRVNRHEDKRRQRFTLAHEIAHFLLHADKIKDSLSDDVLYRSTLSNRLEAEANKLATDILMPATLINNELTSLKDVTSEDQRVALLASLFEVSEVAMSIRLGIGARV